MCAPVLLPSPCRATGATSLPYSASTPVVADARPAKGEGRVSIGMQFMADVTLTCDACKGKRFTDAVLEVEVEGRNIHDILEMTVADASAFFAARPKPTAAEKSIVRKLAPLLDVGLGYVRIGQSATTLSGGEAQRIKLGPSWPKETGLATPYSSSTNPPPACISTMLPSCSQPLMPSFGRDTRSFV